MHDERGQSKLAASASFGFTRLGAVVLGRRSKILHFKADAGACAGAYPTSSRSGACLRCKDFEAGSGNIFKNPTDDEKSRICHRNVLRSTAKILEHERLFRYLHALTLECSQRWTDGVSIR